MNRTSLRIRIIVVSLAIGMICEFIVSPRLLAEDSPATTSDSEAPAMTSEPMMPADKPEWVATIDSLEGSVHRLSVSTELLE